MSWSRSRGGSLLTDRGEILGADLGVVVFSHTEGRFLEQI